MEDLTTNPTARALRTLELVQVHPGITAEQIGDRLGASDRAVRRWIANLRAAGVAIESEPGRYGGYRLGRGHRPPPLVFTANEALALVMAVLDGHHVAADDGEPVGSALAKLEAVLPEHVARHAGAVRRHARAAPDRAAARPDPMTTGALVDALTTRCPLVLTYRPESGRLRRFTVDPWAIVVRHARWYLLCHSHTADAARALRVDRIVALGPLDGPLRVEPPADLDPVAWLEHHLSTGWRHHTHVVFDAPVDTVKPYVTASAGRLSPVEHDRCELIGTTDNPAAYAAERLATIPLPFRVIGGPELRDAVRQLGDRLDAALA